jgi:hypothetical protein
LKDGSLQIADTARALLGDFRGIERSFRAASRRFATRDGLCFGRMQPIERGHAVRLG